jgi:hypothetical protein
MKLLGYSISGSDNDSYMNADMWGKNICDCLDYVKNRQSHMNESFELRKKTLDLSYTYDGYLIVSGRFKIFCAENNYQGLRFFQIPNYPTHYLLLVDNVIRFDTKRRETRFLEFNPECNEYHVVVGATPVCLVDNSILADGFYRTDIEFGNSYSKSPVILAGLDTGLKLKQEKFKGLSLEKIFSKYKWEN